MQHLSKRRGLLGEKTERQSVFKPFDECLIVYGKSFHVMEFAVRRLRRNGFLRLSMAVLYQIRRKHSINRLIAACFQLVTLPRRVCPLILLPYHRILQNAVVTFLLDTGCNYVAVSVEK